MHILLGLVLALVLLFLWLSGHWFGRALVFTAFAAFGLVLVLFVDPGHEQWRVGGAILVVGGWFVSGLPRRYWVSRGVL